MEKEKKQLNIWLIHTGEPMPIINKEERLHRMGMLAEELSNRNHNVLWFASTFDHYKKKHLFFNDTIVRIKENYSLYLLHAIGYRKNISISRIINHKVIANKFKKYSKKMEKPNLIYVSFPTIELAKYAVEYGKKNNVPVIVDIRDLWPDIFKHNLTGIKKFLSIPYVALMNRKTKKIMKEAYAINSISEAMLEWGLKKGNRKKDKMDRFFYIGYNKSVEKNNKTIIDENKFNISFFATINNQFDYDKIIELSKEVEKNSKDIIFNIGGDGPQFKMLKEKTKNLNNIKLLGWTSKKDLNSVLANSKLGIAPYKNTFDFQMSVSNKFSEYISYGLPVLLTSEGYMKELIEKNNCGLATTDMKKMCDFILELKDNKKLYDKMSNNALELYNKNFVAKDIYERLANYLEKI